MIIPRFRSFGCVENCFQNLVSVIKSAVSEMSQFTLFLFVLKKLQNYFSFRPQNQAFWLREGVEIWHSSFGEWLKSGILALGVVEIWHSDFGLDFEA